MRYLKTTIIIVLSFLFCACQKENLEVHEDTKFISFRPILKVFSEPWTRGTPLTYISDFAVISYNRSHGYPMDHVHVSYNESLGKWDYSPLLKWVHFSNLEFLAYFPYSDGSNGISLIGSDYESPTSIRYTVPENCGNQPDLMVAYPEVARYDEPVEFRFEHALACVGFKVKGRFDEEIDKIAIKGVSVSGILNLVLTDGAGPEWIDIEAATDTEYKSLIKNGGITAGNSLADAMDVNGYLMMIPQKLGDDAKLIVRVDGEDRVVSLSGKEWKAGERYTYNLDVAHDPIIIGNFGGWNGTEYTTQLQVDWATSKQDIQCRWSNDETVTGALDQHYGPINIDHLKGLNADLSNYPAVKYCEDKNKVDTFDKMAGWDKGSGWYLPSKNQLMAIWIAYEAIPSKFSFVAANYRSTTERIRTESWIVNFGLGSAHPYEKSNSTYRVRCVRDVTPKAS